MSRQAFVEALTYADEPSGNLKIANSAEVSVFNAGTETLAKLYEERTGGALVGNPFILGATALADFWADSGDYDIKVHDTKGPARFGDFVFGWQASPVNPSIAEGDLSNAGDIEWTQELSGAWVPNLKANSVGANEILTGGVGSLELADGSVISSKLKPTAGLKEASAFKELTEAFQDIAGCLLEITPATASIIRVSAIVNKAGEGAGEAQLLVDGVAQGAKVMWSKSQAEATNYAQVWDFALTAAAHTIKLQAKRISATAATVNAVHTRLAHDLRAS